MPEVPKRLPTRGRGMRERILAADFGLQMAVSGEAARAAIAARWKRLGPGGFNPR